MWLVIILMIVMWVCSIVFPIFEGWIFALGVCLCAVAVLYLRDVIRVWIFNLIEKIRSKQK
jgi:hypothetical protein